MRHSYKKGPWLIEFTPDDGGRLDRIAYDSYDLLTTAPREFRKPGTDYGEYENRPVYGYDDCFPSVESCAFPGIDWVVPDHGEVCWLIWKATSSDNLLSFQTESKALPIRFTREMMFGDSSIGWRFEVYNWGNFSLPFQHVMHPLMKLGEVVAFDVPACATVFSSRVQEELDLKSAKAVSEFLLHQPRGTATMLFLQGITEGRVRWQYANGLSLTLTFPGELFPGIGIWWNNNGYPAEAGIQRNECAFEPIPGHSSNLAEEYRSGHYLSVPPRERLCWQITWTLTA